MLINLACYVNLIIVLNFCFYISNMNVVYVIDSRGACTLFACFIAIRFACVVSRTRSVSRGPDDIRLPLDDARLPSRRLPSTPRLPCLLLPALINFLFNCRSVN
jgi:hypothetical protein